MGEKIWMNGKLVPFADAKVHVLSHSLHYSTSIFEGIRCYNTENGSAIFRLLEHVDRLFKSAKLLSMQIPYSKDTVIDAIIQTVKASDVKECYIRPLAYYGYGTIGLTPLPEYADLSISCWVWNVGGTTTPNPSGERCMVSSWLKIDSSFQPMKAKSASNYRNAALAKTEAESFGYDEAIMLNRHGSVVEGSVENLFVVKRDQIYTPSPSSGILEGITRDSVMRIVEANGGRVIETDLKRDDLYDADEIFMTGTAAEIKSVVQLDRISIGDGKVGDITKQMQKSFVDAAMGKDKRFHTWLTYI